MIHYFEVHIEDSHTFCILNVFSLALKLGKDPLLLHPDVEWHVQSPSIPYVSPLTTHTNLEWLLLPAYSQIRTKGSSSEVHFLEASRNCLRVMTFPRNRWSKWHNFGPVLRPCDLTTPSCCQKSIHMNTQILENLPKCAFSKRIKRWITPKHALPLLKTHLGNALAEKTIYDHTPLTTGTYTLDWNAIQNAENIFSSHQQTAKGTTGSSSTREQLFLPQYGLSIMVMCFLAPLRTLGAINVAPFAEMKYDIFWKIHKM